MMRILVVSLYLCLCCNADKVLAQSNTPVGDWLVNLEKAQKKAKKENKKILLYFSGSDWCGPCKALQRDFFSENSFANYNKHYVMVYIDIPRRVDILTSKQRAYNKGLMRRYNSRKAFPLMMIVDPNGKVIDELAGYSGGDTSYHKTLLDKYRV
ncbi:MAG: thioredoxin family protein [Flavobacteriaceae bacterium]|nr:thioredoxin family protein [Flavobacteriaceae bacterium]